MSEETAKDIDEWMHVEVEVVSSGWVVLRWQCEKGFGMLTLRERKPGEWVAMTEAMSRDFAKRVVSAWIDTMEVV
jgi:hypothetical protein